MASLVINAIARRAEVNTHPEVPRTSSLRATRRTRERTTINREFRFSEATGIDCPTRSCNAASAVLKLSIWSRSEGSCPSDLICDNVSDELQTKVYRYFGLAINIPDCNNLNRFCVAHNFCSVGRCQQDQPWR